MNIDSKFIFYISFSDNPEALINAVFLNNGAYFGLRGRQDHVNMTWGVSWKVLLEDKHDNPLALFCGATVSGGVININVYSGDRKSTINCSQ